MAARRPSRRQPELPSVASDSASPAAEPSAETDVWSVAELDRGLKRMLETNTAGVRVRGEVSGLHRAASRHVYFTLKDEHEDAVIDCVMYRTAPPRARNGLEEGELIISDTLELATLDFEELQASVESLLMAVSAHMKTIKGLTAPTSEGG